MPQNLRNISLACCFSKGCQMLLKKRKKGKLPSAATDFLKTWWREKVVWPYPTEEEKRCLGSETGLDPTQINNWFINQRKRHWHKLFENGVPPNDEHDARAALDQAEADRVIEDDEAAMLHSVFELGDTIVREVMVPRTEMVWIERHKTLRQALSLALRSGFSRIPVIDDGPDDVVGVFYLKDVVNRVFEYRESETTERIDSQMREATFVPDSKLVDDLLRDLQLQRVHMAIAVDEYGGTAGLVTIEDVLEEIVGEIRDEHDTPEAGDQPLREIAGGVIEAEGRCPIADVNARLELHLPEDEGFDTIAGFVLSVLGRVPETGATFESHGVRVRVLAATPTAVKRVAMERVTADGSAAE